MNKREFDVQKGLERAQALCGRQEKCISDIRTKLFVWGATKEQSQKVIDSLIEDNFLNQKRFAKLFASEKARFNKWGPRKIEQALQVKGFGKDEIAEALAEIQDLFDADTLTLLLKNKMRSIKAKDKYDLKNKLIRFGISRGYEYGKVLAAVEECMSA
jgi:regulatory protein